MSITNQINRIQTNIGNAYSVSLQKGATMPQTQNSANLSDTIASIPQYGEVLGFSLSPSLTLIPDTWVQYTTGEEKAAEYSDTFSSTDYFEVCEGLKIRLVNFTKHDANYSGICFYDEDHVYISGVQYGNKPSEMTFTVPAGAKYCRFTISKSKSEVFQCWFGSFAEAINDAAEPKLSLYEFKNITDIRIGRYIKSADGLQAVTNNGFSSTDYIPVCGMKEVELIKIKASNAGGGSAGIAFYNSHMGFISGISYPDNGILNYTCTLPAATCFIRLTLKNGNPYAGRGIMMTDEQYARALAFKNRAKSPLSNKLLYTNGDSITVGYNVQTSDNYDTDLAAAIGMPLNYAALTAYRNQCDLVNHAVSHEPFARISVHGEERNGFLSNEARWNQIPSASDYITLMFGWNDYYWGRISEKEKWLKDVYGTDIWFPENTSQIGTDGYTTQTQYDAVMSYSGVIDGVTYTGDQYYLKKFLGSISDTTPWTWYGAWNYGLKLIKDRRPKAIIGVVMCYGTNADYRSALREVCHNHGIPLLDLYSDSLPLFYGKESSSSSITADQITANRDFVLLSDRIHPSYNGHQRLSDMYSGWLNTL